MNLLEELNSRNAPLQFSDYWRQRTRDCVTNLDQETQSGGLDNGSLLHDGSLIQSIRLHYWPCPGEDRKAAWKHAILFATATTIRMPRLNIAAGQYIALVAIRSSQYDSVLLK
ncbi:hypothetical protein ACHMW7_15945 [Aminobacter sp. UC22_36]